MKPAIKSALATALTGVTLPRKGDPSPNTYAARDALLIKLGYPHYAAYLKSPLWVSIRRRAYAANGNTCHCGKPADQLHHLSYSRLTLLGERLDLVRPICEGCHYKVEFTRRGNKRTLRQAQGAYKRLSKRPRK